MDSINWELFVHSFKEFSNWFQSVIGISTLGFSFAVILIIATYRLLRILGGDKKEVRRRKKLMGGVRSFLDKAMKSNLHKLDDIENERLKAQAWVFSTNLPVKILQKIPGIGVKTIERLQNNGLVDLGDVLEADIKTIRRIGNVTEEVIYTFIYGFISEIYQELLSKQINGEEYEIPFSPEVDDYYDNLRSIVLERQKELGFDLEELSELDRQFSEFESSLKNSTPMDKLRIYFSELKDKIRSPVRFLSFTWLVSVTFLIFSLLPFYLLAWDQSLTKTLAVWSVGFGWFGVHLVLILYFILSEFPYPIYSRTPNPNSFEEQLLQFRALKYSSAMNIAPSMVEISDNPTVEIFAVGSPKGPTLLTLSTGFLRKLRSSSVDTFICKELGLVSKNNSRIIQTAYYVILPSIIIQRIFIGLGRFGYNKMILSFDEEKKFAGMLYLCWFLWTIPFTIAATALRLTFSVIGFTLSRHQVYSADELAAKLLGKERMIEALEDLESNYDWENQRNLTAKHLEQSKHQILHGEDYKETYQEADFADKLIGYLEPSISSRIENIDSKLNYITETIVSSTKALIITGLSALIVTLSVHGAMKVSVWTETYAKKESLGFFNKAESLMQSSKKNGKRNPNNSKVKHWIILKKNCYFWGYNKEGKSVRVHRGIKGRGYQIVRKYKKSSELLILNGKKVWVPNYCIK